MKQWWIFKEHGEWAAVDSLNKLTKNYQSEAIRVVEYLPVAEVIRDLIIQLKDQNNILPAEIDSLEDLLHSQTESKK
jgi:hypothetical protein